VRPIIQIYQDPGPWWGELELAPRADVSAYEALHKSLGFSLSTLLALSAQKFSHSTFFTFNCALWVNSGWGQKGIH
jgi:hypothetical protein